MIVDSVISVAAFLLAGLAAVMPALDSSWSAARPDFDAWGSTIGEKVGPIDTVVPIATVFDLLHITFTYVLPAIVVYSVAHWVYSHLPVIGKG